MITLESINGSQLNSAVSERENGGGGRGAGGLMVLVYKVLYRLTVSFQGKIGTLINMNIINISERDIGVETVDIRCNILVEQKHCAKSKKYLKPHSNHAVLV